MDDLLQQMIDGLQHPLSEYTHAEYWLTTAGRHTVALRRTRLYHLTIFTAELDFETATGLAEEFNKLVRSMQRLKGAAHEQDG